MRIEQLRYLHAVEQHGSLRRAGESIHLSQPALTEALTKLERELRVTLLDRRRTGTRVSAQARELLPQVIEVLDAVERLTASARAVGAAQASGGATGSGGSQPDGATARDSTARAT